MVSLIDSEAKGSMRDFVLVKLTDEEFDDFSARHPQGNFQQTSAMGRLRAAQGIDVEYLALKEQIVAAALFETHRSRFFTFAVIHDGPMCRLSRHEALTFFMDALKRHAKAKGASQLEITPESRIGFATPMELLCRMTRMALPTIS